jgi:hypothetical protein
MPSAPQGNNTESGAHTSAQVWAWAAIALTILCICCVRVRLGDLPLERDEGEYAYAGQLMLQGIPPYQLAYNMKFPGTYVGYAVIMALFGQTTSGVHLGLLLVNALTTILMFFLGRRLLGSVGGTAAAVSYGLTSLSCGILGLAAHATHFVVLFVVCGLLLLLRAGDSRRGVVSFVSGLCFGLALLMKQHGAAFGLFGLAWLIWNGYRQGRSSREMAGQAGAFVLGLVLPLGLACLVLWQSGVFKAFWFWAVSYAWEYVSGQSLASGWQNLRQTFPTVLRGSELFWLLGGVGFVSLWFGPPRAERRFFLVGLVVATAIGVSAGMYFRHHYFILVLPVLALFVAEGVTRVSDAIVARGWPRFAGPVTAGLVILAAGYLAAAQSTLWFGLSPINASRFIYGASPFPEAVEIARYIRTNSLPGARVAVIGSEPEIYFYAQRRSATGYLYTYPLMEPQPFAQTMQENMIREIEAAAPDFLVLVVVPTSWLERADSKNLIFQWGVSFAREHYQPVGIADLVTPTRTLMVWGEAACAAYLQRNVSADAKRVYLLRRKPPA